MLQMHEIAEETPGEITEKQGKDIIDPKNFGKN